MFKRLKIPVYYIVVLSIVCIPVGFVESKAFAEPEEACKRNPHHEKCDVCDESHEKCGMCGEGHHKDYVSALIWLAYSAKKELLKEKMKANLEAKVGKKLDEVANIAVDAMIDKYKGMRECGKKRDEFEERLKDIFREGSEETR